MAADRDRQDYRFKMLEPLGTTDEQPFYKMKVTAANGETKWFNIDPDEFEGLMAVVAPEPYAELLKEHGDTGGFKLVKDYNGQ